MIKKIMICLGALIFLVIAAIIIIVHPVFFMSPSDTGTVQDTDVLVIRNGNGNVFIVNSSDGYIMIDAGVDSETLEQALQQKNINEINHIFLTHSDSDHVASIGLFPHANIYISEDELQMVNGETSRDGNILGRILTGNYNSLPAGVQLENLILLANEQEISIGERTIRGIKMPGHTPGSMIYVIDNNYIFSGDSFSVSNMRLTTHPFSKDRDMSNQSIKNLYGAIKDTTMIFTAHYGYFYSNEIIID